MSMKIVKLRQPNGFSLATRYRRAQVRIEIPSMSCNPSNLYFPRTVVAQSLRLNILFVFFFYCFQLITSRRYLFFIVLPPAHFFRQKKNYHRL